MVKGISNAFDPMEFRLVISQTLCGNLAVTWPPMLLGMLDLLLS